MAGEVDEVFLTCFWVFIQSGSPGHSFHDTLVGSLWCFIKHCVCLCFLCLPTSRCGALYNCAFKK